METELCQDGGQIKREKDIYHHGPKHIPIICHLPDPPSFSLPTTFKASFSQNYLGTRSFQWKNEGLPEAEQRAPNYKILNK
jgi:hypothetical protein